MDRTRFDRFTRTMGTARSRRTVLATLGAAAPGAFGHKGGRVWRLPD